MEAGDVVIEFLLTDPPRMAIEEVNGNLATCSWFVNTTLHRQEFDVSALLVAGP